MKFAIVTHAYEAFLEDLYQRTPGLAAASYDVQMQAYFDTLFATSNYYSNGLKALGHQAFEIVCNNGAAQECWVKENDPSLVAEGAVLDAETPTRFRQTGVLFDLLQRARGLAARTPLRYVKSHLRPVLRMIDDAQFSRLFDIVLSQVRLERPDVLLIQSIYAFPNHVLQELKSYVGVLVGEHAATQLRNEIDWRLYDLMLSSFPPTVEFFRKQGVRAELNRLAFDPRVIEKVPLTGQRDIGFSFSGNFFKVHSSRLALIERVARAIPDLQVWGNSDLAISEDSPLAGRMQPALWGREMLAMLARSRLTLNHHGDVLPFANNMRLYEATGMASLLLTDWKANLGEIFEPEREILTYRDAEECIDKARYYLDPHHETEARQIAMAGHERTVREYTYQNRMRDFVKIIEAL